MPTSEQYSQELDDLALQVVSSPGYGLYKDIVDRSGGPRRFVAIIGGAYSCDGLYIPYPTSPDGWEPCKRFTYRLKQSDVVIHAFPEIFYGAFEMFINEEGKCFKKPLGEGVTVMENHWLNKMV